MSPLQSIQLLLLDVDGVLTDGSIIVDDGGVEYKRFHVRDGFAIKAAMAVGLRIGVISGRASPAAAARMAYLGVELVIQDVADKGAAFEMICRQAKVRPEQTAYVGDDLIDLPVLRRCGYAMAVANAVEEVRKVACYVTTQPGGHAAVREAIEHILRGQGKWEKVVARYEA
ncbi:MAG: HAD-IIIA family hydrolase [Phycisphaeraceae bacterium]|nr:HAD-IIIA family hydrolase [Phycisphaeraceae bacterium]